MKHLFLTFCIACLVFSCKSKKAVTSKETKKDDALEKRIPADKKKDVITTTPKVYASNTERYIDDYKAIAQEEMKLYGIPASITLAQGILESGSGTGKLSVKANNHFGIKCHGWTGAKIYHDDDKKQECFRKYKDAKYSFRDHSLFLSERERYSKLFKLHQGDYTGWARGLRAAGYATDKKYPQKLVSLIERYKLYEIDEEVWAEVKTKKVTEVSEAESSIQNSNVTLNKVQTDVHTVAAGDTQYSISKKYNLTVKELQSLNGLENTNIYVGQVLLVTKSKKESKVYLNSEMVHKVVKGDTLYSISKRYNITVKELQNLNGLSDNTLSVGQTLVVKSSSKR